jgi:hypothetical protein
MTEEKKSDIILSFFGGLIAFVSVAGIMLALFTAVYWYMYPMRCNFEADGSLRPSLSGYFSTNSDGTFNATSELLALNYTHNGSSATSGQLAGSVDANGHFSGQVYCRDLESTLRAYAKAYEKEHGGFTFAKVS